MRDTGFKREDGITKLREWLDSSMPVSIDDSLLDVLRTRFQNYAEAALSAITTRSKDRLKVLGGTLETRRRREIDDMTQLLDSLAKNLEDELSKEEPRQLLLFSEDERTQLRRDRLALEARLHRIPDERERERLAIDDRYTGLVDHTFPVSVIILVPESLALRQQ